MIELEKTAAGMVEDAIQDNANIPAMGFLDEDIKCFPATQQRINQVIVMRVVAMVGSRLKDRVEVDGIDPQVLQVVQFFIDTQKVSTFETLYCWGRVPWFHVIRLDNFLTMRKAVRENLVKNCIFNPLRGVIEF